MFNRFCMQKIWGDMGFKVQPNLDSVKIASMYFWCKEEGGNAKMLKEI